MTNSLLDFVMSLVRDPDAAARYAADPAAAIADAHLTGVTSADVNGLIPMVSDSIAPTGVGMSVGDGNVWTSGAAAAAFDAFDAFDTHVPAQVVQAADAVITAPDLLSNTVFQDVPASAGSVLSDVDRFVDGPSGLEPAGLEHLDASPPDWPVDHHFGAEHPGFDLF